MSKPRREVWLALEEAQSAVTILKTLLMDRLPADDRKDLDKLAEKANLALDRAQDCLTNSLLEAQAALNRI